MLLINRVTRGCKGKACDLSEREHERQQTKRHEALLEPEISVVVCELKNKLNTDIYSMTHPVRGSTPLVYQF